LRYEVSVSIFSTDNLFQVPPGMPPAAFGVMTGFFAVLFLASVFAYWRRAKLAPTNPVLRRFIRRAAKAGMWTSGIALFFCAMRYVEFDVLDWPFWLYLTVLSMVLLVGYFVYDRSERYPLAVWQLHQSTAERKYRPVARPRVEPVRQRSTNVRGKRRR
jgi:hypothetical protein